MVSVVNRNEAESGTSILLVVPLNLADCQNLPPTYVTLVAVPLFPLIPESRAFPLVLRYSAVEFVGINDVSQYGIILD
jgi:hypothetical protein